MARKTPRPRAATRGGRSRLRTTVRVLLIVLAVGAAAGVGALA